MYAPSNSQMYCTKVYKGSRLEERQFSYTEAMILCYCITVVYKHIDMY